MQGIPTLKIDCKVSWRAWDKNGKIISEGSKKGDICLINFSKVLMAILSATDNYTAVDFGGATFFISGDGRTQYERVRMHFGKGTTTPTKSDYCLESEVASEIASHGWEQDDANSRYILRFTASHDFTEARTISEVGLSQVVYDDTGALRRVFYFRDLIGPVDIPAGGGISVTYELYIPFGG